MSLRKQRRAEAHKARKLARKMGFPQQQNIPQAPEEATAVVPPQPETIEPSVEEAFPEPGYPFPSLKEISPAKLIANRLNAQQSTGPLTKTSKAVSAQNHTLHGLARHRNGNFKLLTSESQEAFDSLKQSLESEHTPTTETESILVNTMVESLWLSQRAQHLQDTCINSDSGEITDGKKFSLYMRYQTTHTRAFHKSLNDLQKLRAENRKAEVGFEAQRIASEKHEMKKHSHYWQVLKKDCEANNQMTTNLLQNFKAQEQYPGFEAKYNEELAKRGLNPEPRP